MLPPIIALAYYSLQQGSCGSFSKRMSGLTTGFGLGLSNVGEEFGVFSGLDVVRKWI